MAGPVATYCLLVKRRIRMGRFLGNEKNLLALGVHACEEISLHRRSYETN